MERRELLRNHSLAYRRWFLLAAIYFWQAANQAQKLKLALRLQLLQMLDEVAETIIPATKTPGAKAAQVGQFMKNFLLQTVTLKMNKLFLTMAL